MGKLRLTLALLFLFFVALSRFPPTSGHLSDPTILLPSEPDDATAVPVSDMLSPADQLKPAEFSEEVATVTFRPADHMLDGTPKFPVSFRFPFRGGPSKPADLPADMIPGTAESSNEVGSNAEAGNRDSTLWGFRHHLPHRHDHDMPDAEKKDHEDASDSESDSDDEHDHGMKRFHHCHHHFDMKDDEIHDHHHYHHHHHEDGGEKHLHHHRHHHKEKEEEDKGGFLSYFRKILMDPF